MCVAVSLSGHVIGCWSLYTVVVTECRMVEIVWHCTLQELCTAMCTLHWPHGYDVVLDVLAFISLRIGDREISFTDYIVRDLGFLTSLSLLRSQ